MARYTGAVCRQCRREGQKLFLKGDRVDGARWGYLQYDAVRDAEWFVDAICSTKKRGCTIYRLRGDLFVK